MSASEQVQLNLASGSEEDPLLLPQNEDEVAEAALFSPEADAIDQVHLQIQDGLIEAMQQGDFSQFEAWLGQINFNVVSSAPYFLASACWCDDGRYIRAALQAGVNPNTVIKDGVITDTYHRLREYGISVDSMFSDHHRKDRKAIHLAAGSDNLQVLGVLLDHPSTDKEAIDSSRDTWLHYFARKPYISASRDEQPHNFPHDVLQRIEAKKLANFQNGAKNSFLHLAAFSCRYDLMENALRNDSLELDVTLINDKKETVLHSLGRMSPVNEAGSHMSCIKLLIKKGIDINAKNKQKSTVLHLAAISGNYLVMRALLPNKHMDICSKDNDNYTAFHRLALNNRMSDECMLWCIRMFFKLDDLDVNVEGTSGRTPLHLCAQSGNFVMFKEIMRHNQIQVPKKDSTDMTAIHYMSMAKKNKFSSKIENHLKAVLHKGVDVNSKDKYGQTAFHVAAMQHFYEMVNILLDNGANILETNLRGKSVVDIIHPQTLESYMNRCINSQAMPHENNFKIKYNYKCLLPDASNSPDDSSDLELSVIYSLSKNRHLQHLLCHPLVSSFLQLKWHKWRTFLFAHVIFYFMLMVFVNASIILHTIMDSGNGTYLRQNNSTQNNTNESVNVALVPIVYVCLPVFTLILLGKLLILLTLFPAKYSMTLTNVLELFVCIASFYITFSYRLDSPINKYISLSTIIVSWFQLIVLTGSLPFFSVNLEMLKGVLRTFIKYFSWYVIIVMGFAVTFFVLCYADNGYAVNGQSPRSVLGPWSFIMQTMLMMTGLGSPPEVSKQYIPIVSDVILLLFVIIIVVVLLNLLNGLAIGDTGEIRSQAQLLSQKSMVTFIYYSETMLKASKRLWGLDKLRYMTQVRHQLDKACIYTVEPNKSDATSSYFDELRHLCGDLIQFRSSKIHSSQVHSPSKLDASIIEATIELLRKEVTINERLCAVESKIASLCDNLLQDKTKEIQIK